ncbi:alpha/beta hydrolase [Agrococcus sp. ProA11]|uniref:alpha/beta fold hydrolase n=1 Tax=Agrococcus chionoecetis TaxID=3153752 RepID=UPI0032602256
MEHASSADGTQIAVHRIGTGRPVVIVGGAFSTADAAGALVEAVAAEGFEGVSFDRRGRGDSGDATEGQRIAPFSPEREAEDIAAVIDAVGGRAIVLGHSSGALVALLAAGHGVPIDHLFLSEPPLRFGTGEPPANLPQRLQALVDAGRGGEAVVLFQREGIGLPEPMIEQLRSSPLFEHLTSLAQSTVYDAMIAAATSDPSAQLLSITVPTTVLVGVETMPLLARAAPMLVERMPAAELVQVPESMHHVIDPPATAAIIAARAASP